MSRPVVGDVIADSRTKARDSFNTATLNRALEPLGVKVPEGTAAGHDAIDFAHTWVGAQYDQLVPHLQLNLNGPSFVAKIAPSAGNLKQAERQQLQDIVSNQLGGGRLSGRQVKDAQAEIRRLARSYGRSDNADQRELGRALDAVDDEFSAQLMAQNPKIAPRLKDINTAFRGLAIAEDAASRTADGVFTPNQFRLAVRRADPSRRKAGVARGDAFMQDWAKASEKVMTSRTPDAGTAGRLQAGNPFAIGKGSVEALGFKGNALVDDILALPRPAAAEPVANLFRLNKGPISALAVPATNAARDR